MQRMMISRSVYREFATDDKKGAAAGATKEETKKEEPKEEPKKAAAEEKKADHKKKAAEESSTSSSDEEGSESLSKDDIQKIKKLIGEQDKEIETLKEQVKTFKEKLIY